MPEIKLQTDDLVTISAAARLLKVTRMTVYAMIGRGQLNRLEIAGTPYLLKTEVDHMAAEKTSGLPDEKQA